MDLGDLPGGHFLQNGVCWEKVTGTLVSEEKAVVLVIRIELKV